MRIRKTKSKNSEHYAIIYDTKDINGKRSTKIYQNIGNYGNLTLLKTKIFRSLTVTPF